MRKLVFVGHASEDRATAAAVVEACEDRGIRCWVAPRDIPEGAHQAEASMTGISGAAAFVLVFSDHSNDSPDVAGQVERAASAGLPLFAVRVSSEDPSRGLATSLGNARWVDATSGSLAVHTSQLAATLGERLGIPEESPARAAAHEALRRAIVRLGPTLAEDPRRVEANEIEFLVDGSALTFSVNGQAFTTITRPSITRLRDIGPSADAEPGNAEECRFDDFSVTSDV